jgi:hypothetical protein
LGCLVYAYAYPKHRQNQSDKRQKIMARPQRIYKTQEIANVYTYNGLKLSFWCEDKDAELTGEYE